MADRSTAQDNLPPPPPYVAESPQHGDDASTAPPPAYDHVETPAIPVHGDEKRQQHEDIAALRPHGPVSSASSSSPPPLPPAEASSSSSSSRGGSSSSSNPFNLIRSAKEAYEARQANKKVDYYEKMYGFVPKNVMTEAEWKRVRKEAPRERKPFESYVKKQYFGSWD